MPLARDPRRWLALLLPLLVAAPATAQTTPTEAATAPVADARALLRQVELLVRLRPLNLSDEQLGRLDALYRDPADPGNYTPNQATVEQLLIIQRKLLSRTPLSREDETVLRGIAKASRPSAAARPADRLVAVVAVLTPEQVALCRSQGRQLGMPADKTAKLAATAVIGRVERLLAQPDEGWEASRDRMAEALTGGIQDVEQRATGRENLVAFMDRVRRMGPTEARAQRARLAEELSALFPDGLIADLTALAALATTRPAGRPGQAAGVELRPGARAQQAAQKLAQDRQLAFWLDPQMPEVIRQMRAARQAPPPQ